MVQWHYAIYILRDNVVDFSKNSQKYQNMDTSTIAGVKHNKSAFYLH